MIPLLYLYVYEGARAIRTIRFPVMRGIAPAVIPLALGALLVANGARLARTPNGSPPVGIVAITSGPAWLADNTPPNSIVMTEWVATRYLYAHRKMVDLPLRGVSTPEQLDGLHVDYVLIAPSAESLDGPKLDPADRLTRQWLSEHPDRYRLVFDNPAEQVSIFRVLPA
jgi:hypothetical protein